MKKILILIHDMEIGGAQKSLLSFCQTLAASPAHKEYEVHLMPIKPSGTFYSQIPEYIKIKQPPKELRWLGSRFRFQLLREYFSLPCLVAEARWLIRKKGKFFPKRWNLQQCLWASWRNFIPQLKEQYDVAVSYMDGVPNYYVMEKVTAKKKVLWVHNEYQKLKYDPEYDKDYYDACNDIITISEKCRGCILSSFPQLVHKVHILENITSYEYIKARSSEKACEEYSDYLGCKLLSVGRLNSQKGFDLAVEAAKILRDSGMHFLWLIVGEGAEQQSLQQKIDAYDLSDSIQLIGARENPYTYMYECDCLVQPSRFEGKSVVLDEAKMLCKPIVVTNYTTVYDSIEHGKTGWIVEMTAEAIAQGIQTLYQNESLKVQLCTNLQVRTKDNTDELEKYLNTML